MDFMHAFKGRFSALFVSVLIILFALFPAPPARAVDGVVVSNSVRVVELTRHMRRLAPDMLEFAIQNTSKTAVSFELILSQPDPFHHIFLREPYSPPNLRLIASDDSETTSAPSQPNRINIHLTPGAVQRFILQGQIRPQTGFWLWNPTYKAQSEARTKQFQRTIYATLAILGFLSVPVAVKRRRKRLFLIPIITFGFIFLFFLRWSVADNQLWQGQIWQGEGGVNLRIIIILLVLLIMLAHLMLAHFILTYRAARAVLWIERRYWRTVMVCVDIVLVIVTMGWLVQYFVPYFAGIATRESLELILAFVPALLCLASIISLRLSFANRLSAPPDMAQSESVGESASESAIKPAPNQH